MLEKTLNYTTVKGSVWYSMPNEQGVISISDVEPPKSVKLLRTGKSLKFECREGALRIVVPEAMRTALPDMVKIEF